MYSKSSKLSHTFLFLLSNQVMIFRAETHKMEVGIAKRENPDPTVSSDLGKRSLSVFLACI